MACLRILAAIVSLQGPHGGYRLTLPLWHCAALRDSLLNLYDVGPSVLLSQVQVVALVLSICSASHHLMHLLIGSGVCMQYPPLFSGLVYGRSAGGIGVKASRILTCVDDLLALYSPPCGTLPGSCASDACVRQLLLSLHVHPHTQLLQVPLRT